MTAAIGDIERVRQMVHMRHQIAGERLAIGQDAPDRNAAEADAVVAAFTADEARALALPAGAVIRERYFEGGID